MLTELNFDANQQLFKHSLKSNLYKVNRIRLRCKLAIV